jgi:hypothetical protein
MDKITAKEMLQLFIQHQRGVRPVRLIEWARIKYASGICSCKIETMLRKYLKLNDDAVANNIYLQNDIEKYKCFADSDMLLSILHNLILNGIKYSHKSGKLQSVLKQRG